LAVEGEGGRGLIKHSKQTPVSQLSKMNWLDRIPLLLLAVLAIYMAIAPIQPEPHLVEKIRMLSQGILTRPIDVFDLLMHVTPLVLLVLKLWRRFGGKVNSGK
jgi:hypothetical protein